MPEHAGLLVDTIVNGPFVENCYILAEEGGSDAILIDPGDEAGRILHRVAELGLSVSRIVNTHAHIDHVGAIAEIKSALQIPFYLHPDEQPVLESLPLAAQMFGLAPKEVPTVDGPLAEGQVIELGSKSASIILTPGHSPGGCCLYFASSAVLIAGDTLFAGSIGRTDLPGGDTETLLRSIKQKLFALPDDVVVYPGHGPATTLGREKQSNPFLQ